MTGPGEGTASPQTPADRENAPSCSLQARFTALTLLQCRKVQDFVGQRKWRINPFWQR